MKYKWNTLQFNVGKKKYKFEIVHNLEELGLDIESALISWSARTNKFTEQSFCEYAGSKDILIVCMTKEEFDNIYNK